MGQTGRCLIGKAITLNTGADGTAELSDVSHKVELKGAGVEDDVRVTINIGMASSSVGCESGPPGCAGFPRLATKSTDGTRKTTA